MSLKAKYLVLLSLVHNLAFNDVENKIPNVNKLVKKKLTITQTLVKMKRKLLIMIMVNILLLQSLIS